ncbi:nucleic acid/nucleotide deaminase domain-containing protein [Aspergillus stella-maris]|uniref:nucleic acid/nucleotide deaminase domain-containing protein n=1 Tax=Aspergillus stella-maris TaxID=1810926 RepID=UPI003CCCD6E4
MVLTSQYNTHKPKELRRFYEPLGILYELTMRDQMKPRSVFSVSARGISIMQRRRDFVDSIAFIGAYSKECEIAVALERQPDLLIVRVAGTGETEKIVVPFLNDLLTALSTVVKSSIDDIRGELKDRIVIHLSDMALDFGQEKIFAHYMKIVQDIAPVCLADIATGLNEAAGDCLRFKGWFQDKFYKNGAILTRQDMRVLARECLHARQSGQLELLKKFTFQGSEHVTYFEKFYNKLANLSRTIDMVSKLYESTVALRQDLANDLVAESLPSSPSLPVPLLPNKLSMESISNRMFSDSSKRDDFLQKLQQITPPSLAEALVYHSKEVTEVHPELIVINHFDRLPDGGFLDEGDKYIGCTRPSCYLCHLFVSYHPARYSGISANSKICLKWRLPDIWHEECNAMTRAEYQKSILRKLINTIRIELEEKVNKEWMLQSHYSEWEAQWTLPVDDDTVAYGSPPSSPKLTSASRTASISQATQESVTKSDRASDADKASDEDAEDIVLFKGRCRH